MTKQRNISRTVSVTPTLIEKLDERISEDMLVDAIVRMVESGDARLVARGVEIHQRIKNAWARKNGARGVRGGNETDVVRLKFRSVLSQRAIEDPSSIPPPARRPRRPKPNPTDTPTQEGGEGDSSA